MFSGKIKGYAVFGASPCRCEIGLRDYFKSASALSNATLMLGQMFFSPRSS